MKEKQTDEILDFIIGKKNTLIAAAVIAAVAVMVVLSVVYLNQQRRVEASAAFSRAIITTDSREALTSALRDVSQAHRRSVYATYSLMLMGQNLIDDGLYREAVSVLEDALRSPQSAPFLTAMILETKATAQEFNGSLSDAISSFERALFVSNNYFRHPEIRLKLALLNLRTDNATEAQRHLEAIVADENANERVLRIARNELAALEI